MDSRLRTFPKHGVTGVCIFIPINRRGGAPSGAAAFITFLKKNYLPGISLLSVFNGNYHESKCHSNREIVDKRWTLHPNLSADSGTKNIVLVKGR
jgi:hypothetical protein